MGYVAAMAGEAYRKVLAALGKPKNLSAALRRCGGRAVTAVQWPVMANAFRSDRLRVVRVLAIAASPFVAARVPGCASTPPSTQPDTVEARQDAAMKDPFNYKPTFSSDGGNTATFDHDGFKKDVNDVINP